MKASLPLNYNVYAKKNKLYVVVSYKNASGKRIKNGFPQVLTMTPRKKKSAPLPKKSHLNFTMM